MAFDKYEIYIEKYYEGSISLNDIITEVEKFCYVLPVLELVNGVKIGRDKILDYTVRLGSS